MHATAIIPARFGSTRFPGKPLLRDSGKYLIQHVYEQAARAKHVRNVVVATDDQRILDAVHSFGGRAEMTRVDHPSGTDRVAECAKSLGLAGDSLVLNVQGDEPEMDPAQLDQLVETMHRLTGCGMGTLACPFAADGPREGTGSPLDPNRVKVVVDAAGRALYFSRSLIPYPRDTQGRVEDPSRWLLHLGVYAYRMSFLQSYSSLSKPSIADACAIHAGQLEDIERLEQLRAMAWRDADGGIAVAIVDKAAPGVDTPEDYAAFLKRNKECRMKNVEKRNSP